MKYTVKRPSPNYIALFCKLPRFELLKLIFMSSFDLKISLTKKRLFVYLKSFLIKLNVRSWSCEKKNSDVLRFILLSIYRGIHVESI